MGTTSTPLDLVALIDAWESDGRPDQDPIGWNRARWVPEPAAGRSYPCLNGLEELIAALPNPIGRADVREYARRACHGQRQALEAFVASMVWGFGGTGYAAYRTNRVLAASPDAAGHLQAVAQALRSHGPVEGYRAMANEHRLKWLGPAFGTKYLHFCSSPDEPALVLDALVATWLNEHCGSGLRPARWSTSQYERYLGDMSSWSDGRCTPIDLETRVFVAEASRRRGNQWAKGSASTT